MALTKVDKTVIEATGTASATTFLRGDGSWTAIASAGLAGVQVYTTLSSTWTKAARESALGITITKVIVELQGAGGSGGANLSYYGGGAGGGFAKKLVDVSSVTASTISVGAGGTAVAANGGAGIAGGLSSWADAVNTDVVGNGGSGKPNSSAVSAGGTATGGDINIIGGQVGNKQTYGGDSMYGAGVGYEFAGQGYGGGGSHGYTTYASGAGANGIVIVWEYQ